MAQTLVVIFSLLFPVVGICCSCGPDTLTQKAERADYIYYGQIKESKLVEGNNVENKLIVLEVIKGKPETLILKSSVAPFSNCVMYAATGVHYIVFGKYGEVPQLSFCSDSTSVLSNTENTLNEVRKAANKSLKQGTPQSGTP